MLIQFVHSSGKVFFLWNFLGKRVSDDSGSGSPHSFVARMAAPAPALPLVPAPLQNHNIVNQQEYDALRILAVRSFFVVVPRLFSYLCLQTSPHENVSFEFMVCGIRLIRLFIYFLPFSLSFVRGLFFLFTFRATSVVSSHLDLSFSSLRFVSFSLPSLLFSFFSYEI